MDNKQIIKFLDLALTQSVNTYDENFSPPCNTVDGKLLLNHIRMLLMLLESDTQK